MWDKMTIRKLKTLKSQLAVTRKQIDDKAIQLREEKFFVIQILGHFT